MSNGSAVAPVRPWVLCGALAGLALLAAMASLRFGYVPLSWADIMQAFFGGGLEKNAVIVRELRLPRVLLTLIIGAVMGLSGAVLQGLLRNPLAEPGVIGISSSAALGAVVALYFGLTSASPVLLPLLAMTGALTATVVLYLIARNDTGTLTLILAGVALNGFSIALTSLAMNLSPNPYAVAEIIFWLMGSVRDRSMSDVGLLLPFALAGVALLAVSGRALNALSLGEESAASLGHDLGRTRILVIVGMSAAVGASVAVAGSIAFIGLVVPHLMRPLTNRMPATLMIPSALGGAVLLTAADTVIRLIARGPELQLGVVTSLLGAPFFFFLTMKLRRRGQ